MDGDRLNKPPPKPIPGKRSDLEDIPELSLEPLKHKKDGDGFAIPLKPKPKEKVQK